MDTMEMFLKGQKARQEGARTKTFDWIKCAEILHKEKVKFAEAGLEEDWGCTGDKILENGRIIATEDNGSYLSSIWATPVLKFNDITIECWKYLDEVPKNERFYWNAKARKILEEGKK